MMKKLTALMLVLTMLLSLSTAFAWSCPSCGSDNGGKFCTECGTKKPDDLICPTCGTNHGKASIKFCTECGTKLGEAAATAAPTAVPTATPAPTAAPFAVTSIQPQADGSVALSWAGGEAPYMVVYGLRTSDDADADLNVASDLDLLHTAHSQLDATVTTLYELIPGESYWVALLDAQQNRAYATVQIPAGVFTDFETELVLSSNPVDASKSNIATDFANALHLGFVYNNPGEARELLLVCAVDYGNGRKQTTECGMWVAQSGANCLPLGSFSSLEAFRADLEKSVNFDLADDVILSFYLDGKLAGQATLPRDTDKPLQIIGIEDLMDGTYRLTWEDNGNSPWEVHFVERWSDDFAADINDPRTSYYFTDDKFLREPTHILKWLVPGMSYWIEVKDSKGNSALTTYDVGMWKAPMNSWIETNPRVQVGEDYVDLTAFTVSNINNDNCGLALTFHYDNIESATDQMIQFVLRLPDGVSFCIFADTITLYANGTRSWPFLSLNWAFDIVKSRTNEIPLGEYMLDVYLQGEYAASAVFHVTEATIDNADPYGITIVDVLENANGTATLTWTDANDNGPYSIQYVPKVSDDFHADHAASAIVWAEAEGVTQNSYTLQYLAPGQAYWLCVYDQDGMGAYQAYTPAAAQPFSEFTLKMDLTPVWRIASDMKVSEFSSAEISLGTSGHGLELWIEHPQLARTRNYLGVTAITAPDGSRVVVDSSDWQMDQGKANSVGWEFFDLAWYFGIMTSNFGAVPLGTHTVEFFCDGELACSGSFVVVE